LAPKSRRRRFENDSAFLAPVGFLKMTWLYEKANQLLAMSRGNIITGLTFSRHSSGILGSFLRNRLPNLVLKLAKFGSSKLIRIHPNHQIQLFG
jgi:hypothetical protein